MNTFLLFCGYDYYPAGGWNDFVMAGSLDECKAKFVSWNDSVKMAGNEEARTPEWAHIVDASTLTMVLAAGSGENHQVIWRTPTFEDM